MKIRPAGAEFFHADRKTGRRDEANNSFSRFCYRTYERGHEYHTR
jgi:hypothetical protein